MCDMKLLIEISGTKILVTPKQLDTIVNTINASMTIENKYVPGRNGNAASYIDLLRPMSAKDMLRVSVLSDEDYDALTFITGQYDATQT